MQFFLSTHKRKIIYQNHPKNKEKQKKTNLDKKNQPSFT